MSNELTSDLKQHFESWSKIRNEFETVEKENEKIEIILASLKKECKASRDSEKSLSSLVNNLRKQTVDNIKELTKLSTECESLKKKKAALISNITELETDKRKCEKRYEIEKKELCDQLEILKGDLRRQGASFKDENELLQSKYLFQICELNEEINQMKSKKSDDLNNTIVDYEKKLCQFQLPFKQLEDENSNLRQHLKEKVMENSILTQNLKEKQMEILRLKNKIDNMEQTRSTTNLDKVNNSNLNKNDENTVKQAETKNFGIMAPEKHFNKREAPLNVVFNHVNKKIPPIYKRTNSIVSLKKNVGKTKNTGESSFNDGCVYSVNSKVVLRNSPRKFFSEKRNLESKDNENDPPSKKLLPYLDPPTIEIENVDEQSNRKKPSKKRALFSHSKIDMDAEVPLDDVTHTE